MLKLAFAALLIAGSLAAAPVFTATAALAETIGAGCTLNPFDHTMRCIDWSKCTKNKNGQTVCPVTITSTRRLG
ncbi:MAG: hypothetical protein HY834_09405 [Devosia nanyangense]|uniref:DUF3551 domain-containing protein n=1 Tax=Devosia nanyangense TaxID=1228055 RepID=A0A933NYY2_9HYPH|nr:hypothetical protein [Devosia nanyangense]